MLDPSTAVASTAGGSPLSSHIRGTVTLALPIIVSRAGLVVLFTVDTLVTGRLGGLELAGFALGASPLLTLMMISMGAMQAAVVLSAQAIGAGDPRRVGLILRAGCANALALGLATIAIALFAEPLFLATGQQPEVARVAAGVAIAFGWGMPGHLLFLTVSLILEATGRPKVGMVVMLVANLVNLLLDGVFVLGWGGWFETGTAVIAMATTSVVRWGTFAAAFAVLVYGARRNGDPWGFLAPVRVWLADLATVGGAPGRQIRRMGLPMGLGQGVESACFSAMIFLAGLISTTTIAAHQTTMTVMALVYMNAVGLGGAASIRVGEAVGRRSPADVRRAGWSAIGLGALFSGACGVAIVIAPREIALLVVDDPETVAIAAGVLRFAGLVVAFDSMMGVAMGALRGLGDVWVPMWMQAAAFWFVGFPAAVLTAIVFEAGAIGLIAGIAAGIAASLALLLPRFAKVSARIVAPLRP